MARSPTSARERPVWWSWLESDTHEASDTDGIWDGIVAARPLAEPSRKRWMATFAVVALLLVVFGVIAVWGLARSEWFHSYGYGAISDDQWDEIAALRARVDQLGLPLDVTGALDDALIAPRPTTEKVLFNLKSAALALGRIESTPAIRAMRARLGALIDEIDTHARAWATATPYLSEIEQPIQD